MNTQQQPRALTDCVFVVHRTRSICSPNFTENRAAFRHDLGYTEAVADFDELATRDDHFAAFSQRGEHEQDRGRTVVHYDRGFGTGQALEQLRDVNVAFAAGTGFEVVFEIAVLRGTKANFFERGRDQRGAAEVGVQDNARRVNHWLQRT